MIYINDKLFVLSTKNTTYAFEVTSLGLLEHLYYGRKITLDTSDGLREQYVFAPGNTNVYSPDEPGMTLEDIRLEVSGLGKGDFREPFIEVVNPDGSFTSDFVYDSYSLAGGKDGSLVKGDDMELPSSYGTRDEVMVLTILLKDTENNLELELIYSVFEESDIITRSAVLKNNSGSKIIVKRLMSSMLDFDPGEYTFTTFTGAWAREMNREDMKVGSAKLVNSSYTGTSSNKNNPFVMLSRGDVSEDSGECFGINLIYSGNHYTAVQKSSFAKVRLVQGINPQSFTWTLNEGESLAVPECVMTYSRMGYNGISGNMHYFVNNHVIRGSWKNKTRPILLNSWEAAYFDINEHKLLSLAKKAKDVGVELFVMDDGWFGERNDDTSSLGDWYVNKKKLPNGIKGLADKINKLGLMFGIWVEPEMVSSNSNLYRNHPEWAMKIPGKKHSEGRNQMVLDLTRKDVQDYIITAMSEVFGSGNISYVKWDMNRSFTDVFSSALPVDRQGEVFHRYVLGLYRVIGDLTRKFPDILFEGCASGGNRFDLGILSYFPQIWASDNTDAYCRGIIQNGYSYGYPQSCVTAHVSDCPNHQTLRITPLDTRFNVASFGVLGYECNLKDMSDDALNAIKAQVEDYKKMREYMQFGRFYRFCGCDNHVHWTIVSRDNAKAVSMVMQGLVKPNTQLKVLYPRGLSEEKLYRITVRENDYDLRSFGGLINYVAPFHVKQDGVVHNIAAKFVKMHSEKESHEMYGDTMMNAGVHLKSAFASGGYNEELRYYPDFGSRLYFIEG
ncbi:MAG: alpha-galactosidase [Saccharofermentans sp.]|nr:alpha-galactosidase [Saccharofermentans sp.]